MTAATQPPRSYDVIGFGDEVPGVLALVSAAREYRRRTGKAPRSLLMFKGNSQEGVGGHLVRGGLAYLDRCTLSADIRQAYGLPTFGAPSAIYQEFLQRSGVLQIGLDPRKADAALRAMLSEIGADIISRVQIQSVLKDGKNLKGIQLATGNTFLGKQFIDSSVNAELAQMAGVKKLQGFATFDLPESELPVTLVFESQGLSVQRLKEIELNYLKRFTNRNDAEAQRYLAIAAGSDPMLIDQIRKSFVDEKGNLRTMYVGQDHIDIRSRALSVTYHAFRGKKMFLAASGVLLDQANIAILPGGRLSWNALMFYVTGAQAEALARGAAKPTPAMLEEIGFVTQWLKSFGATAVKAASELYIRHAGNVQGAVDPLSGAQMLFGGVPESSAIGTFGYYLDVRGGITGLGNKALAKGMSSISFHHPPLFNIGIRHALLQAVPNLAVVSPASGFDGYACAAGRIVEFNTAVGHGVGIAAGIALASDRALASITNAEVRQVLTTTGKLPRIYGQSYVLEATKLQDFESIMIA
ncbi:MAG: FAD-dependent oxidoreductase [Tildeniella nuda ZEHNDER 1965/U140]|jgi:hypothetical protein|nr:FAD-dependent oxidoreductase [Tildeniella nuda ZEHNDER 1965/U140]